VPGREEYLDSEKYEFRPRDYEATPNLIELFTLLNKLRHEHTALQRLRTIRFHDTTNEQVIAYSKTDQDDRIIVVVSLDPRGHQHADVALDLECLGLEPGAIFKVHDLLTGNTWTWGASNFVSFTPDQPAHILVVED